jgi:photosystem II stability/assembly factor-like uncharacterized protein
MNNRPEGDQLFSLVREALPPIDQDDLSLSGIQARSVLDRVLASGQPPVDTTRATAQIERSADLALGRHAQSGGRRRSLVAVAVVVAAVLIVGAVVLQSTGQVGRGSRPATSAAPTWRLVGDITPSWRLASGLGYEPGLSLACPSATTCYATNRQQGTEGTYGEIEVTHDDGATWQQSILPVTLSGATPLACVDADTCATLGVDASGDATFLETTDGGGTWASVAGPSQLTSSIGVTALACTTAPSCIAVASDPTSQSGAALAFVTNDGGRTWTDSNLPSDFVPGGLQCMSAERCVVSGFSQSPDGSAGIPPGMVLSTSDDGATWATATVPAGLGPLSSISCADAADCVASFFGGDGTSSEILTSNDGGQLWSGAAASGLPAAFVTGVSCPTASDCWAAGMEGAASGGSGGSGAITVTLGPGAEGIVASTADGGQTWQDQQLPPGILFVLDITCPSATNCDALAIQRQSPGSSRFVLLAYGS